MGAGREPLNLCICCLLESDATVVKSNVASFDLLMTILPCFQTGSFDKRFKEHTSSAGTADRTYQREERS